MDIYTGDGDRGETSLYDDKRLLKDNIRVEAYGTIDELVSYMGLAKSYIDDKKLVDEITMVQNKLFIIAANLATENLAMVSYHITNEDVLVLEELIDKYMALVEDIDKFVVPGSSRKSSYVHVARTICRRAERRVITMNRDYYVDPVIIKYLNRLSDLLYAFSRYLDEDIDVVKYE